MNTIQQGTQASVKASHENTLNTKLAQILRSLGLTESVAENKQPGSLKQIDVDVRHDIARVALEAEINNRSGAFRDAAARWGHAKAGQVVADNVIAVNYPEGILERHLTTNSVVEWSVLPPTASNEIPQPSWVKGTVWHLAGVVRRCRQVGQQTPDEIAAELDTVLNLAVEHLSIRQCQDLAEMLGRTTGSAVRRKAAKRALLIVAAAAMFHTRLEQHLPQVPPKMDAQTGEKFSARWPPKKLQQCLKSKDADILDELNNAWRAILAVDYRPIFEAAIRTLERPTQDHRWITAVTWVVNRSLRVARSASSTRHDLMGSIFHRLVDTARYDGSYYTSTSAAILLAGLAIRRADVPKNLAEFSLIDPACGTGTLLMAAAERIRDLRPANKSRADATTLIEDVITGLDVNMTACHMAATTLGLLSPSTTFRHMNIRLMPLGVDKRDNAKVGSLELLAIKPGAPRLDLGIDWASGEHIDTGEQEEITANSQQLVIMNPPYTRDSLRHDQFPPAVEKKLKAAEKKLRDNRAGHRTSSGTMFMDLGEHLVSFDQGATLAFVYPAAGAAAPSNVEARKLLAEWFNIEWVVAAHDQKRPWFSESTSISEILVVARRRGENGTNEDTKFLILRDNPREPIFAASLVAALENGTLPSAVGTVEQWPAELVKQGIWRPLTLTSTYLVNLFGDIETSVLFATAPVGEQADIGPDGRNARGLFTKSTHADQHGRRALWHNNTKATQSMAATTDTYIHAKQKHQTRASAYWGKRSHLLLAVSPRLNTARVHSVRVDTATVGSHWVPIRFSNFSGEARDDTERAVCAYFNSTLGWLSTIAVASPKVMSRPTLSLNALARIPIPILNPQARTRLARAYDKHAHAEMLLLREAANDPTRCALDAEVAAALNIDTETIRTARYELAQEPSVK
ncbi:MAG: hypothetical protein OXB90_00165 [Acidimicrobiaceae bacterium]|nr:hypothetical protein [Acidimicrobiaceae bacterium]